MFLLSSLFTNRLSSLDEFYLSKVLDYLYPKIPLVSTLVPASVPSYFHSISRGAFKETGLLSVCVTCYLPTVYCLSSASPHKVLGSLPCYLHSFTQTDWTPCPCSLPTVLQPSPTEQRWALPFLLCNQPQRSPECGVPHGRPQLCTPCARSNYSQ